jgi:hypothetical protein
MTMAGLTEILAKLLWTKDDQYNHELEYGRRTWVADALMWIQMFDFPGKEGRYFGDIHFPLARRANLGWRFVEVFDELTDVWQHQGKAKAFRRGQRWRNRGSALFPEYYGSNMYNVWIFEPFKDDPTIEILLELVISGPDPRREEEKMDDVCYSLAIGFMYEGDRQEFVPQKPKPPRTLREVWKYKVEKKPIGDPTKVKCNLASYIYPVPESKGAWIQHVGSVGDTEFTNPTMRIHDKRLRKVAEHAYKLIMESR